MKCIKIQLLSLILLFAVTAHATVTEAQKKALKSRQPGLTSQSVQRRLMRANELVVQNDRKGAIEILEKMTEKDNYRPFEKAKIWQTLAYAYAQTEKYDKAREAFKKVISLDAMPYKPHLQSVFALAQLQVMAEKYKLAEKTLEDYFALSDEVKPDAHVFSATISYHKGDKKAALTSILKALELVKNPKENWIVFAVSLLYETNRYKEASELLYKLVEINTGKKMYWVQLAGTLINQNQDFQALAVMDLAMMLNLLDKEGEILNVVSLYIGNGLPYEASQLLEKGMKKGAVKKNKKNQELLANALIQAKEYDKALAPLENAAKLSDDGKLYALKARLFLEKENFKEAVSLFDKALKKGLKKKDQGQVYVEKAVALIQLGDYPTALKQLNNASRFKESEKLAQTWKDYIDRL